MRQVLVVLALALAGAACASDATAPAEDLLALDGLGAIAFGATQVGEPGHDMIARLQRLPAELALSSAQVAQIRALIEQFTSATADDRAALAALLRQAHEARRAGASHEDVRAIMAAGDAIRTRLQQAEATLRANILALLTPEQRAWLERGAPRPCSTLTDAQRTEISALLAAFEEANAADIALIRSVHERARAAQQDGASRQQIAAILAEARQPMQRLNEARAALHTAILGVLTTEQRNAGCFR